MRSTTIDKKRRSFKRGQRAEKRAAWLLRLKGFHIAKQRYKTSCGEVDLIARRGDLILIVEVKARPTVAEAMDAVGLTAQQRIEAAATQWIAQQQDYNKLSIRFDLIVICPWKWPVHIPAFFTI